MDKLNNIIGKNLVKLRINANLTQLQIAEKLNYSDKSVSKWERGESAPDISVLKTLADFYCVKVDDILKDEPNLTQSTNTKDKLHFLIGLSSGILVWLLATVCFTIFFNIPVLKSSAWYNFIVAIPLFFTVIMIFNIIWGKRLYSAIYCSCMIWTISISLDILLPFSTTWLVYIIAIPLQILTILWFFLSKMKSKK
ncbi:MAG: helix-turn-helix transcriptional regulator [Clostridia bacterium]